MTTLNTAIGKIINSRWFPALNEPLHRNGLALVVSMVATSGLGLIYWAMAARSYSPAVVGINSAVISTMMFLSHVAQFGLVDFLTRFIPTAGRRTRRLVISSYLISASLGLIVSLVFVAGLAIWAPALTPLSENRLAGVSFVFATALWCVFALQDGVMIGLRKAVWVPMENVIFSLAKIGLLLLFAYTFSEYGIFASWSLPVIAISLVVNFIIFTIFIPAHAEETETQAEKFTLGDMFRFVSGDYFSTLVWMATTDLMPLLIVEQIGAEANAYFYFPWTISYSLYLVSRSFGMSLTVEAAKDANRLQEYSQKSLAQISVMLLPIVLVTVFGADWVLQIFGVNYAQEGAGLLRLLALSAVPNMILSLYISIARAQRKVFNIAMTFSALCVLAVSLTLLWLHVFGLIGVGLAWLVSQTLVAGVLFFTQLRGILLPARPQEAGQTVL